MRTIHELNKEMYVSPEVEVIFISIEPTMTSNEPIGGGDDPDLPWPNNNG